MKVPQRKPNKVMSNKEFEEKIISTYTKSNPQPRTLEERVKNELNRLNNKK